MNEPQGQVVMVTGAGGIRDAPQGWRWRARGRFIDVSDGLRELRERLEEVKRDNLSTLRVAELDS